MAVRLKPAMMLSLKNPCHKKTIQNAVQERRLVDEKGLHDDPAAFAAVGDAHIAVQARSAVAHGVHVQFAV